MDSIISSLNNWTVVFYHRRVIHSPFPILSFPFSVSHSQFPILQFPFLIFHSASPFLNSPFFVLTQRSTLRASSEELFKTQ